MAPQGAAATWLRNTGLDINTSYTLACSTKKTCNLRRVNLVQAKYFMAN